METSICAVCGQDGARLTKAPFAASYNGVRVELSDIEMVYCDRCGESVFTPEQNHELTRRVNEQVRDQLHLLPPDKIVSIRKRYGMSQRELENLLGLGEKVVTRWERGKVLQNRSADAVLRLMDRMPEVVEELRRIYAEEKVPA